MVRKIILKPDLLDAFWIVTNANLATDRLGLTWCNPEELAEDIISVLIEPRTEADGATTERLTAQRRIEPTRHED